MATDAEILADLKQAYQDNKSYLREGSLTKAHAFREACIGLIGVLPQSVEHGGSERLTFECELYERQAQEAKKFIDSHSGASSAAGSVRYFSLEGFR